MPSVRHENSSSTLNTDRGGLGESDQGVLIETLWYKSANLHGEVQR